MRQQVAAALKLPAVYRPVYVDEVSPALGIRSPRIAPFLERLTQFWSNHFAVSVDKIAVLGLAGAMEREAIRPHVTGHFTDLLLAVEQHPAMLLYLDNQTSIGPELESGAPRRSAAATAARWASTKTWRARFSSCTRWV